jgi:hypothetical protein
LVAENRVPQLFGKVTAFLKPLQAAEVLSARRNPFFIIPFRLLSNGIRHGAVAGAFFVVDSSEA